MATDRQYRPIVRFGAYEADLKNFELRKHGLRIRLQDQPFQILALLLGNRGRIVSRSEIRDTLWPEGTFVEYDHGINTAMQKIRRTINDSARNPRFIETLPRRGYRFIAPVEFITAESARENDALSNRPWAGALAGVATLVERSLQFVTGKPGPT